MAATGGGAEHGHGYRIVAKVWKMMLQRILKMSLDLGMPDFCTDLKRSRVKLEFVCHLVRILPR